MYIVSDFTFLLEIQAAKNQPVLICPNGCAEQFFFCQRFIVLGTYNFATSTDGRAGYFVTYFAS